MGTGTEAEVWLSASTGPKMTANLSHRGRACSWSSDKNKSAHGRSDEDGYGDGSGDGYGNGSGNGYGDRYEPLAGRGCGGGYGRGSEDGCGK